MIFHRNLAYFASTAHSRVGVGLAQRLGRKLEIVRSRVRFPGQVMILGRNGTDDQEEQVEGLIAGAVVANTNVASAHPRPVSSHQ